MTTKGVLIDLGGVVYQGDMPLPGAIEAIGTLRDSAIPFRFLTNTTSQPKRAILEKLEILGVPAAPEWLYTPATAARRLIAEEGLKPHFLIQPLLMEDFENLPTGGNAAVIVGDAGDGFTYEALNAAFRKLDAGADLIALAKNRKFVGQDGEPCLDAGAFVAALEYASGRKARVIGKPAPAFFHAAAADMGLAPDETVMIGDDAEFDASAAVAAGLAGVLVHTGKWTEGAADGLDPPVSLECADLRAAVSWLVAAAG
jgi:HAD superfamily hydrolase (TIGR01458 family)